MWWASTYTQTAGRLVRAAFQQLGTARTFDRALQGLADWMTKRHPRGSALRVQVLHAYNPPAVDRLRELIEPLFECTWMPTTSMSPVLAAHTGPSMAGVAFAPLDTFADIT